MRQVMVYKYVRVQNETGYTDMEKQESYIGVFHAFGVDYEEFENGPGNFSTAIIEKGDGSIENVPVHLVKFLNA